MWPGFIVADIKTADGAAMEVEEAYTSGANAVTVLGNAPKETIDIFIEKCNSYGMDSMIDMIAVQDPLKVLRTLKKPPSVVILHRGRDEENVFGKVIEYRHISRIRSKYDVLISAAGGVDLREAHSAVFNGADIVVVNIVRPQDPWRGISTASDVRALAYEFLKTIE